MRKLSLIISVVFCSICFGQSPTSHRYCIDVIKSEDGKYYALYSDKTWEESTYATAQVFKAASNKKEASTQRNTAVANTYGIASSTSPTRQKTSSNKTSSNSKNYQSSGNSSTKKTTSRTYIRGPRGGCYYINSNGGKTYVDRSLCN